MTGPSPVFRIDGALAAFQVDDSVIAPGAVERRVGKPGAGRQPPQPRLERPIQPLRQARRLPDRRRRGRRRSRRQRLRALARNPVRHPRSAKHGGPVAGLGIVRPRPGSGLRAGQSDPRVSTRDVFQPVEPPRREPGPVRRDPRRFQWSPTHRRRPGPEQGRPGAGGDSRRAPPLGIRAGAPAPAEAESTDIAGPPLPSEDDLYPMPMPMPTSVVAPDERDDRHDRDAADAPPFQRPDRPSRAGRNRRAEGAGSGRAPRAADDRRRRRSDPQPSAVRRTRSTALAPGGAYCGSSPGPISNCRRWNSRATRCGGSKPSRGADALDSDSALHCSPSERPRPGRRS